jgi:hypothetical protein
VHDDRGRQGRRLVARPRPVQRGGTGDRAVEPGVLPGLLHEGLEAEVAGREPARACGMEGRDVPQRRTRVKPE